MPAKIQATHPWYPRLRFPYQRQPAQARGGGGGRGGKGAVGGGLDTTPTGSIGGDIIKAIGNQIQMNRQNAAANAILNTQTPPRAGLVAPGVSPTTGAPNIIAPGTPITGAPPQTGGTGELQMRTQQNQADLADQLQRAKIASEWALAKQRTGRGGRGTAGGGGTAGGNASRWQQYLGGDQAAGKAAGKAGKAAAYEPGSIDPETDPNADKFQHVQADFDAKYGKGAYARIAPNLANASVDKEGNYTINSPTLDAAGNPKPIMTLPKDQANYWLSRYNAASVKAGQQPLFTDKFPSANPTSGQPGGTEVNPYKPANQLEARSLPYRSFFIDPTTNQVGQKLPEDKAAPPAGQKTSQADTGDQGQGLADVTQPQQPIQAQQAQANLQDAIAQSRAADQLRGAAIPAQPPPQLAALTPPSTPGSFDLGQPPTGGLPQDTALADAIARARTQNQLMA